MKSCLFRDFRVEKCMAFCPNRNKRNTAWNWHSRQCCQEVTPGNRQLELEPARILHPNDEVTGGRAWEPKKCLILGGSRGCLKKSYFRSPSPAQRISFRFSVTYVSTSSERVSRRQIWLAIVGVLLVVLASLTPLSKLGRRPVHTPGALNVQAKLKRAIYGYSFFSPSTNILLKQIFFNNVSSTLNNYGAQSLTCPIRLPSCSVNHRLPSGPAMM